MKPIPNYENYLVSPKGYVVNSNTGRVLKTDISKSSFDDIRRRKTWKHISSKYVW